MLDVLERMAFAAELLGDPRAKRYGQAAWALRSFEGDLAAGMASGELAKVRGLGKGTLAIVEAVLAGERPEALAGFEAQLPAGLFEVRRIKGLGAKKVGALHRELGIASLGELEYACRENRLVELKGFGPRTQASVLEQLASLRASEGLSRRDRAEGVVGPWLAQVRALPGVEAAEAVGELPRGMELVSALEVLVAASDEALARIEATRPTEVTLHAASRETFGARAVWLTSSEAHREALATHAEARGRRFSADGLQRGEALVPCPDDEALYRALGLVPTPPERREPAVPLVHEGQAGPRLVTRADLRGALHNHTVASDGSATLPQMAQAAAARGLEYLGISDHSHSAFYARGLDAPRLLEQVEAVRALDAPCAILTGVESDILADGSLDYPPQVLAELEVVVASVHRRHAQSAEAMTARMCAAARNPWTAIVGHPTGRLLLGRPPSDFDVGALLDACVESGCAVELNANPHRLDLSERHLAMAKERGLLVSIAADAHSTDELDHLEHGVAIARRAGLSPEDVLNARSLGDLRAWLAARRARALA